MMSSNIAIFECSNNTYIECIQNGLFGSNMQWPMSVKTGDLCFLYHYGIGCLFGIWYAECDGARKINPKIWNGKFQFQVRVKLASPNILEVPKNIVAEIGSISKSGRLDNLINAKDVCKLMEWVSAATSNQ